MEIDEGGQEKENVLEYPFGVGKRRYDPEDIFFDDGNLERERHSKWSVLIFEEETRNAEDRSGFLCGVFGCSQRIRNQADFAVHYEQKHRHRCSVCFASFPASRLLDLHIRERHDRYFAAQSARSPMFECLVEGCRRVFKSSFSRRAHLIDKHKYPRSFRFHPKTSRRRRLTRKKSTEKSSCDEMDQDEVGAKLIEKFQKLRVPESLSFGRKRRPRRTNGSRRL